MTASSSRKQFLSPRRAFTSLPDMTKKAHHRWAPMGECAIDRSHARRLHCSVSRLRRQLLKALLPPARDLRIKWE